MKKERKSQKEKSLPRSFSAPEAEYKAFRAAAKASKKPFSLWVRTILTSAVPQKTPMKTTLIVISCALLMQGCAPPSGLQSDQARDPNAFSIGKRHETGTRRI